MADLSVSAQFHLQEHRLLRDEIYKIVSDIRMIQRGAILVLGAYLGWMSSSARPEDVFSLVFACWMPFVFALLLREMTKRRVDAIFVAAEYLRELEAWMAATPPGGWETFLLTYRKEHPEKLESTNLDKRFWTATCVLTGLIAVIAPAVKIASLCGWNMPF